MTSRLRFLAVDDDPAFLLVLAGLMQRVGHDAPVTANSGPEALLLLSDATLSFDCVLLDIQMPGMDGIETCRRIRAKSRHRDTPIIMITTLNGRDHVEQAFNAGATDYLTKPLHRIDLNARLGMTERLIRERGRASVLQQRMATVSDLPGIGFAFTDAVLLPQSDQLIDYLALQNYLLTLSRLSLHAHVAMAFLVEGAAQVYDSFDRVDYLDFMAIVGGAIAQALKTQQFLLAHAGRGEFVSVLHHAASLDGDDIRQTLSVQLQTARAAFVSLGLPMPFVRVGAPQRSGIFSASAVPRLLQQVRSATQFEVNTGSSRLSL